MYQDELLERIHQAETIISDLREQLVAQIGQDGSSFFGFGAPPAIKVSADGKIAIGRNGLDIEYRGSDHCPYGRSATRRRRPFEAIIVHHTASDHMTDWYVQYQIDGDPDRGGHFGYHFYIAPSGKIIQGAPLTKRTNHVKPSHRTERKPFGRHAQNSNAIGITCARAGKPSFQPTPEQIESLEALTFALCQEFGVEFDKIYGHGEVQADRHQTEGTSAALAMRAWNATGEPGGAVFGVNPPANDDMDDGPIHALEMAIAEDGGFDGYASSQSLPGGPMEDADDLDQEAMTWWSSDDDRDRPLGASDTRLNYTNQSAIRNKKCTRNIERLLVRAVEAVYGPGCAINIYSGGQDRPGQGALRTGSIRHDDFGRGGRAADVHVFDQNGRQIKALELAKLGQYWLASNFGGVGHEMRGGGIHLDEWTTPPSGGGMFWTYAHSNNLPWGAEARRMLQRGAQGEFP